MTDLYAQTWFSPDGGRNRKAGGCGNDDTEISRRRHGKSGKRRHDCVTSTSKKYLGQHGDDGDHLRFDAGGTGHNPCKNLNGSKYIGGGRDGRGNQKDFAGRSKNFGDAEAGLKCKLNSYNDASLRSWYQTGHIDKTGATGTRGDGGGNTKFRTFYEQLLFGIKTDAGTQRTGYCTDTANLMKEVGGGTCYAKIKSAINDAEAENTAREWCKTNRTSEKCKCVNVQDGGTNFINHCKSNPTWSGCPEITAAIKKFEDAGLTSASGLFGNADCLVPGLCDGSGVVMPSSGKPNACSNKLAICDQQVATDNIEAQNLLIEQGCEINFEADVDAPDGQTAPPPPPPPSPSPSPLSTSSSASPSSTNGDDDGDGDEDEFYEKPGVQIGAVGSSSMVSIFSCLMLIMLTV